MANKTQDLTIEQAFESYIGGKYIHDETWGAEEEYRRSLLLIQDSGIDVKNTTLAEFNTAENMNKIFAENQNLLEGNTTVNIKGKPIPYTASNIQKLGNNVSTILNNLRSGEVNQFTIWNKENQSVPNPAVKKLGKGKTPYTTLGFKLTDRDKKGLILLAPDHIMVEAFYKTLNDITDVQVGNRVIPKKVVQAHALLTFITGMRQADTNRLLTKIDPEAIDLIEDLKDTRGTKNPKTFLLSAEKSIYIHNKNKKTVYGLNPFLWSILSEAAKDQEGVSDKLFGSTTAVQNSYTNIFKQKLKELGYPDVIQLQDGVRKKISFTPRLFRKFSYSFARRLYIGDDTGLGVSRANALIQHEGRSAGGIGGSSGQNTGEQHYLTGQQGVFQETDATRAQNDVTEAILDRNPDKISTTPLTFLQKLGFSPLANIFGKVSGTQKGVEKAGKKLRSELAEELGDFVFGNFDEDQHGLILSQFNSVQEFKEAIEAYKTKRLDDAGVFVDPLNNAEHLDDFLNDDPAVAPRSRRRSTGSSAAEPQRSQAVQEQINKLELGKPIPEDSEVSEKSASTRSKDLTRKLLKGGFKAGLGLPLFFAEQAMDASPASADTVMTTPFQGSENIRVDGPNPLPRTSEKGTEQRRQGDEDRFIMEATPDKRGMQYLDDLEGKYQRRVDRDQPAISSGIMRDSGITELDPRTIDEEQLDKIQAAKKDLQQQAAELFNIR